VRLVSAKVLLRIHPQEELSVKEGHRINSDALFTNIPLVISESLSREKGRRLEMHTLQLNNAWYRLEVRITTYNQAIRG